MIKANPFLKRAAIAVFAVSAVVSVVQAADAFYIGRWKIDSAVVAPWWKEAQKPDDAEMKQLVGKTMVITAKAIQGPRQHACADPRFKVKDYPADMLFQGGFGEMHLNDKSVDPVKVAAKLGFHGTSWKTLETGCATEIDYHFLDSNRAAFALNNYIYYLTRQ